MYHSIILLNRPIPSYGGASHVIHITYILDEPRESTKHMAKEYFLKYNFN